MPFLSFSYWFDLMPAPLTGAAIKILLFLFLSFLILSLIFKANSRRVKDNLTAALFKRASRSLAVMGFLGLFLLFFTSERVFFLGARFWFIFWLIGFLVWLGFILRQALFVIPRERAKLSEQARIKQYLPKKSKHRS